MFHVISKASVVAAAALIAAPASAGTIDRITGDPGVNVSGAINVIEGFDVGIGTYEVLNATNGELRAIGISNFDSSPLLQADTGLGLGVLVDDPDSVT